MSSKKSSGKNASNPFKIKKGGKSNVNDVLKKTGRHSSTHQTNMKSK